MQSITFEICVAEDDPLDRTLGVMIRSGSDLILARSVRPMETVPLGTILLWIDRITLLWGTPMLRMDQDIFELLDTCERTIGSPF